MFSAPLADGGWRKTSGERQGSQSAIIELLITESLNSPGALKKQLEKSTLRSAMTLWRRQQQPQWVYIFPNFFLLVISLNNIQQLLNKQYNILSLFSNDCKHPYKEIEGKYGRNAGQGFLLCREVQELPSHFVLPIDTAVLKRSSFREKVQIERQREGLWPLISLIGPGFKFRHTFTE